MAMAVSEVAELATTTDVTTTVALGTFTPSASSILVAYCRFAGSDLSTVGTLSDSEGAWTEIRHEFGDTNKAWYLFYRKVDATPVSITPTFDNGGDTLSNAEALIYQFVPDVVVAGNPIRQTVYSAWASSTNPSIVFASALQTANGYIMVSANGVNPYAMDSPPSSWTQTCDTGITEGNSGLWGAFRAGGETGTTITATNATSTFWQAYGVEVYNDEPPVDTYSGRGIGRGISRGVMR